MPIPHTDPIIVAPTPNPFGPDEQIDHDKLARNIERWLDTRLSGFVVGSAGGEEFYLGDDERIAAVATVAQANGGQKFVIGGIDNPSTTETLRLASRMAEAGADMVRVRIPARGSINAYYEEVTKNCPVPVIIIHQTWQTGAEAGTPEEIGAICSLDNVYAYIFWHNVRFESRVRAFVPEGVKFWTPNGSLLLPGALIGANGACCFFANMGPDMAIEIMRLGMAGRFAEAQSLQKRIINIDYLGMALGNTLLKGALDMLGFECGPPRRPTPALSDEQKPIVEAALREAGLL